MTGEHTVTEYRLQTLIILFEKKKTMHMKMNICHIFAHPNKRKPKKKKSLQAITHLCKTGCKDIILSYCSNALAQIHMKGPHMYQDVLPMCIKDFSQPMRGKCTV